MKANVKKVDKDGRESEDSKFWTYDLYCDTCGQFIQSYISVRMPDRSEKEYCHTCTAKEADSILKNA